MKRNKIKVMILEDNIAYLNELSEYLVDSGVIEVVSKFETGRQCLNTSNSLDFDVALIDMNLPDMGGCEVIEGLKQRNYQGNILVITAHDDVDYLINAFHAGAMGYILKGDSTFTDIEFAVLDIVDGEVPLSVGLARRLISELTNKRNSKIENKLDITHREEELLNLLSKGYTAKEVSELLSISYQTVRTHIRNIYQKLDVSSLNQAIAAYNGLH